MRQDKNSHRQRRLHGRHGCDDASTQRGHREHTGDDEDDGDRGAAHVEQSSDSYEAGRERLLDRDAEEEGGVERKAEAYGDGEHVVGQAQRVGDAGAQGEADGGENGVQDGICLDDWFEAGLGDRRNCKDVGSHCAGRGCCGRSKMEGGKERGGVGESR